MDTSTFRQLVNRQMIRIRASRMDSGFYRGGVEGARKELLENERDLQGTRMTTSHAVVGGLGASSFPAGGAVGVIGGSSLGGGGRAENGTTTSSTGVGATPRPADIASLMQRNLEILGLNPRPEEDLVRGEPSFVPPVTGLPSGLPTRNGSPQPLLRASHETRNSYNSAHLMRTEDIHGAGSVGSSRQFPLCCNKVKLCPWKELHESCEFGP